LRAAIVGTRGLFGAHPLPRIGYEFIPSARRNESGEHSCRQHKSGCSGHLPTAQVEKPKCQIILFQAERTSESNEVA
jgi:hypothetical protein